MSPKRAIGILLTGSVDPFRIGRFGQEEEAAAPEAGEAQPEGEAPSGDQPSKVLERAFKLYDGEDYYSASIELNKVIEGESGDSEPNKQKAEFWMGKALYNMKFYSASLSYFDRIVQKGPSHAYYNATLKWLASLSRQLPDSTGILEKIGKYNRAELDQPALEKVRDELYFLLGKFYYQKGNFKEAVELFQAVPPNSEFYVAGQAVRGRDARSRVPGQAGRRVVQGGLADRGARASDPQASSRSRTSPTCRWRAPSTRPASSTWPTKYFDRVSQESYDWANSLFESSWANFMLKQTGLLEGARQHPHDPGAVLRELHQARVGRRGADRQGDHLLLQLPLRPRRGGHRRVQRDLPGRVPGAEEADHRDDRTTATSSRSRSRSASRPPGCRSRSSAPRAASSAT